MGWSVKSPRGQSALSPFVGITLLATLACRPGSLSGANGVPRIQAGPGTPSTATVTQEATTNDVVVNFGPVLVGETETVPLEISSNGTVLSVNGIADLQSDAEFGFPLQVNDTLGPSQVYAATFTPSSGGEKTALYQLTTDSSSVPKITITFEGTGVPAALQVSPNPLDFGNVVVHHGETLPLMLHNVSSADLDLQVGTLEGAQAALFTLGSPALNPLPAGKTTPLPITYAPLATSVLDGGADSANFTVAGCSTCATTTVQLLGRGIQSSLLVTPNPLDFGFVQPNGTVTENVHVQNIGVLAVTIQSATVTNVGNAIPAPFSQGSGFPSSSQNIAPGTGLDFPVTFQPPSLAEFQGDLTIDSTDPGNGSVDVKLSGYGGGASIACLPTPVDFGPMAVGQTIIQSLICTNVGTDILAHPEAALQISAATTDNSVFSASLPSPSPITLTAGQSATLTLGYTPTAVQSDTGHLLVVSNDLQHLPLVVPLQGHGIQVGPCQVTLIPASGLDFGEVASGFSVQLQFGIENSGTSFCLVTDLALAAGSDPAFSLVDGNIAAQLLSFPGNSDNAGNLPTVFDVPVQYAPTTSSTTPAQGSVAFQTPVAVSHNVSLVGSSAPACLTFDPSNDIDFGLVGYDPATQTWCNSSRRPLTLTNSCSTPITIDNFTIDLGTDPTAQFSIVTEPNLGDGGYLLASGSQIALQLNFEPTLQGPRLEDLQIATQEFSSPYLVDLRGDAELSGQRTDTFVVPTTKVDLLWVVDTDDDLATISPRNVQASSFTPNDGVPLMVQQLPALFSEAAASNLDYQMAVTGVGPCNLDWADQGYFDPCSHCGVQVSDTAEIITPQTVNGAGVLTQLILGAASAGQVCTSPTGGRADEEFFDAAWQAFQPALLAGHNSGFLRPDAYLAVIALNGDKEDDRSTLNTFNGYLSFWQSLKVNPSLFSWSYANAGDGIASGDSVGAMVQQTGGLEIDISDPTWSSRFLNLFSVTTQVGTFTLSTQPVLSTIAVTVNGILSISPDWSYDPTRNAVVFSSIRTPAIGDTVVVTYSVGCAS